MVIGAPLVGKLSAFDFSAAIFLFWLIVNGEMSLFPPTGVIKLTDILDFFEISDSIEFQSY
jgi:hypothetical protein